MEGVDPVAVALGGFLRGIAQHPFDPGRPRREPGGFGANWFAADESDHRAKYAVVESALPQYPGRGAIGIAGQPKEQMFAGQNTAGRGERFGFGKLKGISGVVGPGSYHGRLGRNHKILSTRHRFGVECFVVNSAGSLQSA